MSSKFKKVVIVLRMTGAAGRDILSGIFMYTRQHPGWSTRLVQMPSDFTPDVFNQFFNQGYDGIIASETGSDATAELMARSSLPISFIGSPDTILASRKQGIFFTCSDDVEIGRAGARYLAALGRHRSYGFVPTTVRQCWSDARRDGFIAELASQKIVPSVFSSPSRAGTHADFKALRNWLLSLSKPTAIMAAWDDRATQVLQACSEAGIAIPSQLSLLGVDNDELLAESVDPPLSSIPPDHEKIGYVAARELNRLMNNPLAKTKSVFFARPKPIVERESAIASSPAAHLLSRANEFIVKNATKGINAADVVSFLGVSRRLADLRFHQFNGDTINETIIRTRLDAVKKLLATTNRPIRAISLACGYTDVSYLKKLFRKRFGVSMRNWRKMESSHTNP